MSGTSNVHPESAVLSGVVDTGGDPGTAISAASSTNPFTFGGLVVTGSSILNGFPVNQGYYSTVLFEADPLSDYTSNGDQPGPDVITAATLEVPITAGLSAVHVQIGGTQAVAQQNGSSPLEPGTKYVYFIQQQTGETNNATTVNEFSSGDLAAWASGSGSINANGWSSGTKEAASNDYTAWSNGTGSYGSAGGAADPNDPTLVPGQLINPDWQCVPNASPTASEATTGLTMPAVTSLASNTNATWQAELAANQVPTAAGSTSLNGTALPDGIASVSATGAFTPTSGQQPAEQGSCFYYYDGASTLFYASPVGMFTTPKLGSILVKTATVAGHRLALTIANKSSINASGLLQLTIGGKTIASAKFHAVANGTGTAAFKLNGAGVAAAKKHERAKLVLASSNNDQPLGKKSIRL
ncbi:MAG TPA: hypothetical protein VG228_10035 [Solirubrobacteraceae bacterium]|nr:hypothetical protein [Solirubrobacteraceae bacterium]